MIAFCSRLGDLLFCLLARVVLFPIRIFPLSVTAAMGRMGGEIFFWLNPRRRRVAIQNLTDSFAPEKSPKEIRLLARENFQRIGETFTCAVRCCFLESPELRERVELRLPAGLLPENEHSTPRSRIIALGHFGNFEIFARFTDLLPIYQGVATTYRGLKHPRVERLIKSLRGRSGCLFYERRTEGAQFRAALRKPGLLFGLFADQHAGASGLRLPFLGRDCSTSAAPALLALRFRHPLHVAICHRVGSARWCIELSEEIPTRVDGSPRTVRAIMADVNGIFEQAIRRDPSNWFWVHKRWKAGPPSPPVQMTVPVPA